MSDIVYNSFKKRMAGGEIDLGSDAVKVMLVTSGYAADRDSHEFKGHVTGEASGAGYGAGGQALTGKSVTQDNSGDKAVFDADDALWPDSTITARGAVLYKDTGDPATSPLICYMDFGSDKSSMGGDFELEWQAGGILNFG